MLLSYPQLANINIDMDLRRTSSLKMRARVVVLVRLKLHVQEVIQNGEKKSEQETYFLYDLSVGGVREWIWRFRSNCEDPRLELDSRSSPQHGHSKAI